MVKLQILKEVKNLRTVWVHEAIDFTPWLSQYQYTCRCSRNWYYGWWNWIFSRFFNVDISVHEIGTDRKVIIENQLEDGNSPQNFDKFWGLLP